MIEKNSRPVYKNDTQDAYVYRNGQYESAKGYNGYSYGQNRGWGVEERASTEQKADRVNHSKRLKNASDERMYDSYPALNRQVPGDQKTLNREARREYEALDNALEHHAAGQKNDEQRHRLESERALMQYPNELSQLTDRMASDSWQG